MKKEVRFQSGEIRAIEENDEIVIEGYAIVWDSLSSYALNHPKYGTYWEKIDRHAFDDSLENDDVLCLFDHESSKPLARNGEKDLILSADDHGLKFRCNVAPTSYGKDLQILIGRKVITGCSFSFRCPESDWEAQEDGTFLRTIKKAILTDVSPVSYPTYLDTEVALRSLQAWESAHAEVSTDVGYLDYLQLKLRLSEKSYR